jgi:tryptophan-rich sensory protein
MTHAVKDTRKRSTELLVLIYFLVAVVGMGSVLGVLTGPDVWYANLVKPSFNPPSALFAPVWTLLNIMIAVAGWRIWRLSPKSLAMLLWAMQMALNWLWSPVFFLEHQPDKALIIMMLLLITVLLFIIQAQKHDKIASWLFIPYAVWVGFATILNAAIYWLN